MTGGAFEQTGGAGVEPPRRPGARERRGFSLRPSRLAGDPVRSQALAIDLVSLAAIAGLLVWLIPNLFFAGHEYEARTVVSASLLGLLALALAIGVSLRLRSEGLEPSRGRRVIPEQEVQRQFGRNSAAKKRVKEALEEGPKQLLPKVDLRESRLVEEDLRGADLTDALLQGADLRGAKMTGADLRGAQLEGAELADAELTGSLYDKTTRWPDNLDVAALGALNEERLK